MESYDYICEEMAPAVGLLYPIDEDTFYLGSYDGIFLYNLGEIGSTRLLAPYETDAIVEGCRWTPIAGDKLAVTNYEEWGEKLLIIYCQNKATKEWGKSSPFFYCLQKRFDIFAQCINN